MMNGAMIYTGIGVISRRIAEIGAYIDDELQDVTPTTIILTTMVTAAAVRALHNYTTPRWGETRRQQLGRLFLQVSYVKKKYQDDIQKQFLHFEESVRKKWEKFPPLCQMIPSEGHDPKELINLIQKFSAMTAKGLQDKHLSGTIYSKSLDKGDELNNIEADFEQLLPWQDGDFSHLSETLKTLFTKGFQASYLWNSLHSDEFGIGAYIDRQVVLMAADMFGGRPNDVKGFVTSGGTESLMLAIRSYRNWGMEARGHKPGEGVVIACKNVHAAVLKAGEAYLVNVHLVETDDEGKIDLDELEKAMKRYGNKVIAIIGSTPSYPLGVIDPIEKMAKMAHEHGCGLHVDACLGAFIVNNIPSDGRTDYLNIPGVTSLSADTHKNGLAPKGSSVLVTKQLEEKNLAYHSIYTIPDWEGGVYGTPKDAGSQSCVQSLNAFLAMAATGKSGYRKMAKRIHATVCLLGNTICEFKGKIRLVAKPEVNVVAFQIDKEWGLQKGATYFFAGEMAKRGIVLNTLKGDKAHFCVTLRTACDSDFIEKFRLAMRESLEATKQENDKLAKEGKKFSGDAGMYCAIEAAISPKKSEMSVAKYAENFLFGERGAKDAVKSYFLALLDPFT